jgi:hypothetical protein
MYRWIWTNMDMAEEDASKIINRFCGTKNKKNKIYIYGAVVVVIGS